MRRAGQQVVAQQHLTQGPRRDPCSWMGAHVHSSGTTETLKFSLKFTEHIALLPMPVSLERLF